jgi:hypothetical protein
MQGVVVSCICEIGGRLKRTSNFFNWLLYFFLVQGFFTMPLAWPSSSRLS